MKYILSFIFFICSLSVYSSDSLSIDSLDFYKNSKSDLENRILIQEALNRGLNKKIDFMISEYEKDQAIRRSLISQNFILLEENEDIIKKNSKYKRLNYILSSFLVASITIIILK